MRDEVKEVRRGRARCGEVGGRGGETSRDEARQDKTGEYTADSSRALGTHTALSRGNDARPSLFLSFSLSLSATGRLLERERERKSERERRHEGTTISVRGRERESARERESTTESRVGRLPVNRLLHSLLILYERPPMLHRNSHFTLSLSCAHATAGYAFAVG